MPDPFSAYLEALEQRGFIMQTGYDGRPTIFVVRWKSNGEMCGEVEEVETKSSLVRSRLQAIRTVIEQRKSLSEEETMMKKIWL